jgi:hypothetical protein
VVSHIFNIYEDIDKQMKYGGIALPSKTASVELVQEKPTSG